MWLVPNVLLRTLKMNKKSQKGTSLIEVLVTVLILATSLLAMAALQSRSVQHNHSSYLRSQANILAYDIIDRIRIATPSSVAAPVRPSDANITNILSPLPGGEGKVDCDGPTRVCTVVISWKEQDGLNEDGESSSFAYTTRI